MNREIHVRFWGGLEVKFLRSTRLYDFSWIWNLQISDPNLNNPSRTAPAPALGKAAGVEPAYNLFG